MCTEPRQGLSMSYVFTLFYSAQKGYFVEAGLTSWFLPVTELGLQAPWSLTGWYFCCCCCFILLLT